MDHVEVAVTQITSVGADADPGRRERKKQRTRDALFEAAMDLFMAKGYDQTAVHEITDAVDVSERTFFRYFASKEDLVLSFISDGAAAFAEALAARPPEEEPLAAARQALQSSIREMHGGSGSLTAYLAAMRLIDSTPSLLAAYLRSVHEHDDEIIEVLARREGVDPVTDRRPRVLAAVIGALVFLANKDWQASDTESPEDLAAAFDAYADVVLPALSGHWTPPHHPPQSQ
jgi:AcrR family transcriptional regulator